MFTNSTARLSLRAGLLASATMVAGLGIAATAHAQTAPTNNDFWTRPTLTGDWGGKRTVLKNDGLTFNGFYTGEFGDVLSGGKRSGNDIASQFGLGADVDLGKVAGLDGGGLHIMFNQRVGRSVSADDIGNKLAVQEVYGAGETLRIVEFSYDQKLFNNFVNTKIGFYPMGNDFAFTPLLCAFQNVGFCAHPQNLPNSSGWSDSPTGKWGGRIKFNLTPNLYVMTGAFDVNPSYSSKIHGLKTSLSGSTGALVPVEAGLTTSFSGLPGHYKVGVYYDTSNVADAVTTKQIDTGRYGAYILADQMVYGFDNSGKRGLIAFAQASYSDPDTAVFQTTFDAGLIAQGPFDIRPHDFIAAGYVYAGVNKRVIDHKQLTSPTTLQDGEGVFEVGYGFQATPWLLIHPNVQYINNPGAFAYKHIQNAWAFGTQAKVVF